MNYGSAATAQERVEFGPVALVSEYVFKTSQSCNQGGSVMVPSLMQNDDKEKVCIITFVFL